MSEASEEPMVCVDCGGTMTDEDAFSMSLGEYSPVYWHEEHSGCLASLGERLTAATKRAEAWEKRARKLLRNRKVLRAERDALRKDAARLDWLESEKVFRASVYYLVERRPRWVLEATDMTDGATLREAIDAAMEAKP
jgi:hypothetical protein